jgi:hypothetical protein
VCFDLTADIPIEAGWRFSGNKRHKVEFSWFRFDRGGTKTLDEAIEIPDGEAGTTTIGPGSVESTFNFGKTLRSGISAGQKRLSLGQGSPGF